MSDFIRFFWDALLGRKGHGLRLLAYLWWCLLWAIVLVGGAIIVDRIVG